MFCHADRDCRLANLAEGNIKEVAFTSSPYHRVFALGILFTEWIRAKFKEYDLLHWRQIVVFCEALLLFFPAFMASGRGDTAVNILVSSSAQSKRESRKVNGHSVATTMCTGNLRSATEQIFHYVRTRDPDTRKTILSYYEIVVFFAPARRYAGSRLVRPRRKAILFWLPSSFIIGAFLSMFAKEI